MTPYNPIERCIVKTLVHDEATGITTGQRPSGVWVCTGPRGTTCGWTVEDAKAFYNAIPPAN